MKKDYFQKNIKYAPNYRLYAGLTFFFLVLTIFSVFGQFTSISQASWINVGMGIPVMISCFAAMILLIYDQYFFVFFILIFNLFFLFHDIIIIYDNEAVLRGLEIAAEETPGLYRYVADIFSDAFKFRTRAIWSFIGLFFSFISLIVAWINKILTDNKLATQKITNKEIPA
ncbi:MAG: hypothetical protein PHF08_00050 [Candidatus Riflebacteria bacterium]|nr:hypothetical protein [Candidatus Riflebacteria bacterium]